MKNEFRSVTIELWPKAKAVMQHVFHEDGLNHSIVLIMLKHLSTGDKLFSKTNKERPVHIETGINILANSQAMDVYV